MCFVLCVVCISSLLVLFILFVFFVKQKTAYEMRISDWSSDVCSSIFVPRDGKTLVLVNGAYGQRIAQILEVLGGACRVIDKGDYLPPRGPEVAAALDADPAITHVVLVHCETSSGILNPVAEIAEVVAARGRKLLIDSMSAFGALPLDVNEIPYTAMLSSPTKCTGGVPGFGFVIAQRSEPQGAKGRHPAIHFALPSPRGYHRK